MKSDRLLSILLLLQTRDRVTATELARRLEVSTRTVYRDIDSLSAAGVPVYSERGRHGGIALLPGFRTDVTGLTADESRALFVLAAQSAHSALGLDQALGSALRKVMAALPAPHRPAAELTSRRILVDPDRWMRGETAGDDGAEARQPAVDLDVLHTAVFADRRLRVRYRHSGTTEPRSYTLDPYGLVAKAGVWYLVADRRGAPQLFRADRVLAARVTDAPVRRREGMELAEVWQLLRSRVEHRPEGVRVQARVRVRRYDLFRRLVGFQLVGAEAATAGHPAGHATGEPTDGPTEPAGGPTTGEPAAFGEPASDAPRTVPDGDATRTPGDDEATPADGWVAVELRYPVLPAVRQLLQFGPDVEVLAPPEARRELVLAARQILTRYGDTGEASTDAPEPHEPAPVPLSPTAG